MATTGHDDHHGSYFSVGGLDLYYEIHGPGSEAFPSRPARLVAAVEQQGHGRPEDWPKLVGQVVSVAEDFEGWSLADARTIAAPVMVMIGDNDIVRPEHAVEMSRLLPRSRLAVLPGKDAANGRD